MKKIRILIILIVGLILTGCARYSIVSIKNMKYSNYIDSSIELTSAYSRWEPFPLNTREGARATAFILKIKNKTDKDLTINWNKTLFIKNNQTDGSFMLSGQMYIDRNRQKILDIVFPKSNFEKIIYPSHLVSNHKGEWINNYMGTGKLGVWLTFSVDGKEMHKKMIIEVKKD